MDQSGKVANLARHQLNMENNIPLSPCVPENLVSRETGSAVSSRVSLLISILRLNLVLTYGIPPEFRKERRNVEVFNSGAALVRRWYNTLSTLPIPFTAVSVRDTISSTTPMKCTAARRDTHM